ncbi:MAG: glyoxalase/bleomycin resistance/extradiol dioxygenase family protein [Gammaproteobacteria bacterium]|uniref:glyoxalase/bleomycin resistance/extradiol dioxygenase family protein n=1 Tax=Pseudomaricurvus alcaniphilus TaxID=1166482 RepID=UPI00140E7391|nr:glyoxalase/bleomycin resistance/extradiol dioxygenase family protein [Pseudomaricurvus alcaniphilus]MBR9911774.1 glyoxalase/bleomycin resistance/extradiol dioxygenase family protein [Gammaproteobacteria bacterium]NHN39196.1 glyoxalase/bleomycin resistance/extradiol dioxygenase family protein [Pseudomaricurvus alcaniphilus]
MTIEAIDHINIRTDDVVGTSRFFADVLAMEICDAPGIPDRTLAAWLCDNDGRAVIHLGTADVCYPCEQEVPVNPTGSGRIHHVAFRCSGYKAMTQKLTAQGRDFQFNLVEGVGLRQLFLSEPNGILLELNFFGD